MLELASILHSGSIAFIVGATACGVGISVSKSSTTTVDALDIQPSAFNEIFRLSTLGAALIETAGIINLIMSLMLLGSLPPTDQSLYIAIGYVGIAAAIGIAGFTVSSVSLLPVQAACYAVSRQPFFSQRILNLLLITLSIVQSPFIFAFLISLLIKAQLGAVQTSFDALRLLASGLCIGVGSIGGAIGLARFSAAACESIGINRNAYSSIVPFTFISAAIIETPLIFSFLIAIILVSTPIRENPSIVTVISYCAAAFCASVGTFAPSINSSITAAAACKQITYTPENYLVLSRISMICQALIDAVAVYALLIALFLILM